MIKIKKIFFLFSLLFLQPVIAENPEILVYSKVEDRWNVFLLREVQTLMSNLEEKNSDPYTYEMTEPLVYDESKMKEFLSGNMSMVFKKIEEITNIKMLDAKPKLSVNNFKYHIEHIRPSIMTSEGDDGNVLLASNIKMSGIHISAKSIVLEFVLKDLDDLIEHPIVSVTVHNPVLTINSKDEIEFDMDVLLNERQEDIEIKLSNGDFSKMNKSLTKNPSIMELDYDENISIPDASLEFSGREFRLNRDKIIALLGDSKAEIANLFIAQIQELFAKDGGMEVLKHFDGTTFPRMTWIDTESESVFPVMFDITDFSSPQENLLVASIRGDFCTKVGYKKFKGQCVNNRMTHIAPDTRDENDLVMSKELIIDEMNQTQDLKTVMSLSEGYINKALATTIDFGLWKPIMEDLDEEGLLTLHEKGISVKMDNVSDDVKIILNFSYYNKGLTGVALGERTIHFPIVMDATARIEYLPVSTTELPLLTEDIGYAPKFKNGIYMGNKLDEFFDNSLEFFEENKPHLIFKITGVDDDFSTLMNKSNDPLIVSTISKVRRIFRKKVMKVIQEELSPYKEAPADDPERDVPPILLPELDGLSLEKATLKSDGNGRVNIYFNQKSILGSED